MSMAEPSSSAGAAAGWALLSKLSPAAAGVIGAAIVAAVEPPATRRLLFIQVAVGGTMSLVCGPGVVAMLDHYTTSVDLAAMSAHDAIAWAAPVYLIIGAVSWGVAGALARLRAIIRDRAADKIANQVGG